MADWDREEQEKTKSLGGNIYLSIAMAECDAIVTMVVATIVNSAQVKNGAFSVRDKVIGDTLKCPTGLPITSSKAAAIF
uniref:Uncharacterized protein n=1 Tax=Oryza barthii TaxID=65489 RepID=A0A0D3F5V8_9ORYZ